MVYLGWQPIQQFGYPTRGPYSNISFVATADQGNKTTPSYVALTPMELLVGVAAKNQVARNSTNCVFGNFFLSNKKRD